MQPGTLFKINVNLLTTQSTTLSVELALNGVKITSLQKTVRGCHTTEISFKDSKSRLIYQHLNRTLSRGVLDNTFSVPSSPNLGTWKVQVESEVSFILVVPNFYVSINCDKTSLDTTTRTLKCTVTTRDQWDDNFISSFLYFLRLTNEKTLKGTYRFQAVTKKGKKDVFLKNTYGDINGNKQFTISWNSASDVMDDITVIAQVGDNTTGTTLSSKRTILLKKDTTTSTWELEPRLLSFQPGLPLKLFIKFASPKSASLNFDITYRHRSIRTCTLASPSYQYKTEWVSTGKEKATPDSNGYGALNLQTASNVYEIILSTYQSTSKKKLTLTAALSSKGQYISIQPNQAYAKVVSRGQMISNGEINGQNRKTQQLSIRVTGKWYPRATVIITYASMETGVVVDSKSFEVIGNPVINTVILRSSKSSAAPKDKVRFHIGASNNSTVYLMSVDKGIHTSQQGFDIGINDAQGPRQEFEILFSFSCVNIDGGRENRRTPNKIEMGQGAQEEKASPVWLAASAIDVHGRK
ncbi:hypothetical protein FSP39_022308 [Pinctada imbricata]|uniref:Alpha-2-macroglobulin bait region domain-containing protein n=1 Tax=Pinctada imbricata TaxID=66713 RepID=A0AA89C001_PINIB|nr:hypothetical protein FSP39_022308 [Pinctada imbricata]